MFTVLDWAVLAAYLLVSLFIGLWVSRGNKNLKEYMFGGGSMPWIAVGISLIATSVSATTFLGAPADVYGDNMTFLMFQIGALLSIVVVGFVFIPRFRTSGINSVPRRCAVWRRFSIVCTFCSAREFCCTRHPWCWPRFCTST